MKTQKILSLILAMALVFSIGCVSVFAADAPMVFDDVEETITLPDTFEADGEDGAIRAENGAKLTINGTGTVKALHVKDFTMAVWAKDAGTEVIINGGHYENEGDPNKLDQADLIYASLDASIVINGGTFKCATPRWTLNCNNTTGGTITVKGGKFYGFNPAEADTDGDNEIIVPAGYEVVEVVEADGTWYEVVSEPRVYNGGIAILDLSTTGSFEADGEDGAIRAENGAKLTINGTGTVKALHVKDFTMAVWAKDAGTEVIINGGHYENEGDPNKLDQADLIYASLDASIVINGGTFKCATPRWTLNCNNTTGGTITVKGGKFYGFNPAEADTDGDNEIIVPAGYEVVEVVEADGTWYEVVESKEVSIVHDSTQTLVDAEGNGAIRFVFNVNIPKATKTYFGAYMLPLNIFEASGVANAVQVQYDTEIETSSSFAADLVKIPADCLTTSIYAIPYIRTADGVVTFTGASASVQ